MVAFELEVPITTRIDYIKRKIIERHEGAIGDVVMCLTRFTEDPQYLFIHSFSLSFILTGIISNPPRLSRTMEYSLKGNINSYTILNLLVIPCYYINNLNIYLNIYIFIHSFIQNSHTTHTHAF